MERSGYTMQDRKAPSPADTVLAQEAQPYKRCTHQEFLHLAKYFT